MRKYLEDIGALKENIPWEWNENDKRQGEWAKERELYGFDERETWDLTHTMIILLYERLKMYDEINCVDTTFHKKRFKDKLMNQQEAIEKMLKGCEIAISTKEHNRTHEESEMINDVFRLFAIWQSNLWW